MLKKFHIFVFLCLITCSCLVANSEEILNKYFSFNMPDKLKDTYVVSKDDNGIFICEKKSNESGFGGLAFGLKIFKSPKDYADTLNTKKIGELVDIEGIIYDMILIRPTEIQYDKRKNIKKDYNRLYDLAEKIEIKGINGSKYIKNQGTKGEDLYGTILKSYMYSKQNNNLLNDIGYAYYDINSDGIDELFIGKRTNNPSEGIIYDVYTMVNRYPTRVIGGGDKDKYFVCNGVFLCNEYTSELNKNTMTVFYLEKNSTELYPQITYTSKLDKDKKGHYYITYGNSKNPKNVSEKIFKKQKKIYNNCKRFDFIPFNKLEQYDKLTQ